MPSRVGIRREDKNEWERRVPLTPAHVASLVAAGLEIVVQPSPIRVFADDEYRRAGAAVRDDLSDCGLVLAVKEIPADFFMPGRTYMFFSHVVKGQPHNMPMLERIIERGATLIDYERVTDEANRRLIFFGHHAGSAGIIETVYALGKRLEWEGYATPLARAQRPLDLGSLDEGRALLGDIGRAIEAGPLPAELVPMVFGFAGYGNVSRGAQELFDILPHEEIAADRLESFMAEGQFSDRKLYKVVFQEKDIVEPVGPEAFSLEDYYDRPEGYRSVFDRHLPHLTVLVNCIYWDARYPKLLTLDWLRSNWGAERPRLRVIGDITCDVGGSIECTVRATEPGNPTYTYLPSIGEAVDGWEGEGPVVMAVDTLPAEVPREASTSFGAMLLPYVHGLARADFSRPIDRVELAAELKRAVIVHRGRLTGTYSYLAEHVRGA